LELCSAVPPWPSLPPRPCRPARQARHRRRRLRSHRAEPARPHPLARPAARRVPPPLAARQVPPPLAARQAPASRAPLRPVPLRPVIARRRRARHRRARHRRVRPNPPRRRPPAAVGRPDSRTSCCSASAYWPSWPVPGALPTAGRSCGTADGRGRPGLASGRDEDAARLLHQHRHLVGDRVKVGSGRGEHGEA